MTVTSVRLSLQCRHLEDAMKFSSLLINDHLPHEYLATLNNEDQLQALRACLIVSFLTEAQGVPHTFQLQASLAMLHQHDSIIIAGTSSGKTMCILIPILLHLDSISMTISPLMYLQTTQV